MHRVADIISTEARAKYNDALTRPAPSGPEALATLPGRTAGLTYWSPNVNIFRDPRWGRGQETYGEDPYLAGRMGVAFVTGMQGDDPRYLKVVSTPKHYAVHSGPEPERHGFDARVSEYDLVDTYLPAFRAAVVEGKADSIMCVYNAVNGTPGCASADLLQKRLRDEWGFQGYVVSDCGAVNDIHRNHKFTPTLGEAAVAAVKAGTDLTCGTEYRTLVDEVKAGRITEAEIDRSLERLFVARVRLGMFDPKEQVPFSKIAISENDSSAHREVAREAERAAIVLLKNEGGVLPLRRSVRRIAVLGPSADDPVALLGNYNGISSRQVTPLEGIERQFPAAEVRYALGATYTAATPALVPSTFLAPPEGKEPGVLVEYFDNPDLQGEPKLRRSEPRAVLRHGDGGPRRGRGGRSREVLAALDGDADAAGERRVRADRAHGHVELDGHGAPVPRRQGARPSAAVLPPRRPRPRRRRDRGGPCACGWPLEAGRKYALRVEYRQPGAGGTVQLGWIPPADAALAEAVALAKDSDVAIVFVGLSSELEGEEMRGVNIPGFLGGDRTSLDLPEPQENLVKAAIATGKPVVVVLTSGSAVAAELRRGARCGRARGVVRRRGGRHGHRGDPGRGQQPGGPPSGDVLQERRPAARVHRLRHEGPHLPVLQGRAPVSVRLRVELLDLRVLGPPSRSGRRRAPRSARRSGTLRPGTATRSFSSTSAAAPRTEAPIRSLRGFQRIHLRAGESREVTFTLGTDDLPKSAVEVSVGGGQPLAGTPHVRGSL